MSDLKRIIPGLKTLAWSLFIVCIFFTTEVENQDAAPNTSHPVVDGSRKEPGQIHEDGVIHDDGSAYTLAKGINARYADAEDNDNDGLMYDEAFSDADDVTREPKRRGRNRKRNKDRTRDKDTLADRLVDDLKVDKEQKNQKDPASLDDTLDQDDQGTRSRQKSRNSRRRNNSKDELTKEVTTTLAPDDLFGEIRELSDEERLMKILFHNYNPSARPVINSSKTVNVMIQFSLMQLKDLDVRSQIFTTTGLLILEWTDERLAWNPADHNDMKEIIIEAKALWRPEFAIINGAEKIYEDYDEFRAVISHKGLIHWEPGGVFKTMCEIDITYYPFDEQRCEIQFGAWSYHTSKMNLTNSSHEINMDSFKPNGEWEVYRTLIQRQEFAYACCPNEPFANVAAIIHLRRLHMFYVLNVILPSIMTSVLLLSVFFCTPGQKVQIGVVVLLSFRIFLLNVADNIPKTSDHIPLLGIYLTCTMAITTLSMVLTVFVLNLHHVTDKPVPDWAKRIVFLYIAPLLCMCSSGSNYKLERHKIAKKAQRDHFYRPRSIAYDIDEDNATIMELKSNSTRPLNGPRCSDSKAKLNRDGPVFQMLNSPTHKQEPNKGNNDEFARDWRQLAEVFDRLFFWLFLLAILISTLILFHPLTHSYMRDSINTV